MRLLLLISSILIFAQACTPTPQCQYDREYTIRVNSDVYDAYALYVDGVYVQDIPGYTFVEMQVSEGYHEIYVEQLEGYRRQPHYEYFDVRESPCEFVEIIFPN